MLKTGSTLTITVKPKSKMLKGLPQDIGTLYTVSQIEVLLSIAGFKNVKTEHCPRPEKYPGSCILGLK
jgi:hypothetical protein